MTETWREGRKLLDRSLRPGALISHRQMMQEKTCEFLAQLRANPKDLYAHIELSVDCVSYTVFYGY
jgi:cytochrome P450